MAQEIVVILGASENPERYSYKAMKLLERYGHTPILVHPNLKSIDKYKCFESLEAVIKEGIKPDTLTLYVRPEISSNAISTIIKLAPKRVIFNPGTENSELQEELSSADIPFEEACTLVLLNTKQFER